MLVPIGHENMSARRWPLITLGLIVINVVVFLGTQRAMEKQGSQLVQLRKHILVLAAMHPQLLLTPEAQELIDYVRNHHAKYWAKLQDSNAPVIDEWDARTQAEMDSLSGQYSQLMATSISQRYGFVAADPRLITYLTSNFLHGGWWHLLGNVWFLWLAGFVLEDAWGRPLYLLVYLAAGAVSCQFDAWSDPGTIVSSIGASGAIAGLMGAFLVRFPKMKIRMMWFFDLGLFPFWRFWMRAYWLLPIWVLMEINYGMGPADSIGHWAHVGGFIFGAVAAVALRYSGLERKVNRAIEEKVAWASPAAITQANELMEHDRLDEAAAILNDYLATEPESVGGWNLLLGIHWRNHKIPECREAAIKLCGLHLQAGECEAAWQDYNEFLNLGGDKVSPAVWLELCRVPEQQQDFRRAVGEYEKLAAAYPSDRQSLMAQLAAARICLKRLNRPEDALRFYEAAAASAVPHLDLGLNIQSGIRLARIAIAQVKALSAGAPSRK
jgi:membrane associated rhomboid family serine protease